MKVTKKLFLVALLLSLILSVGAVTAQDNMTFEKSNLQDISTETINQKDMVSISNDTNLINDDETFSLGEIKYHNVEGCNFTSIQESIDSANDGDIIYLGGKTYNGIGEDIKVNKQLTIVGGSQSNPDLIATLDAGKLSRIMNVSANNILIKGIKFLNGNESYYGGAIYWTGNNGTISNSSFFNNHAFHAGAIYWKDVNEGQVSECNFINNSADNNVGGLYAWKSNLIVSNSLFENNSALDGSGLYAFWCTVNITDSKFINNYAAGNGGALRNSLATVNIKNGTFENNRANSEGGAIHNTGNLDVSGSNFRNNQALSGGAIYHNQNNCIVSKSFFVDNYAQYGGAITSQSTSNINNNSFKDNDALNAASAILVDGPNNSITSNIIDNGNTDISAILISNDENLVIEDNNFTNPSHSIGYDEIIIEYMENYVAYIGKTVSFPFYVHTTSGKPLSGEVNLRRYFGDGDVVGYEDLGRKTLNDGRTVFDIKLPDFKSTFNFQATFSLESGNIIRNINIEVADSGIVGVYQYDDADNVHVKLVSDATGIVMFDVGGNNYFAEISNGEALINVNGLANGKYAVNLIFSGDDNFPREEKIIVLEVKHAATTVMEVNESFIGFAGKTIQIPVYIHDSLGKPLNGYATLYGYATQELADGKTTFTVTLPDNAAVLSLAVLYGDNVKMATVTVRDDSIKNIYHNSSNDAVTVELEDGATGTVTVNVNGKNYTSIVNNSCSVVEVKDLANGDYAATVIYSGDEKYPKEEKIIILEVKHAAATVIEVNESFIGFAGKTIQIPVYIHDSLGNPLTGYVTLYGYATRELVDGKTTFTITLPDHAALLSIAVLYDGDVKMTQVAVRDDSIKNIYHNSSDDTVTVELEDGATGTVTVNVNGKNYTSIVNNSCSVVEVKDLANGDYAATVIYSGDEKYSKEEKIIILTVKHDIVIPDNPVYKISQNKDINVIYSGKAAYKVLITKDDKPVAGENVVISFNGKNINAKTDANGYATLNLDTNLKPGTYTIKATYNGVSVTNKVKITQIIKASDKKVKKSSKTTKVKISLSKVDGKYLKGKTLKVKFNGKTYNVKTNSKGVGIWNVKKSMLKKLKANKKYKYTVSYGRDTLSKKLTVRK